MDTRHSGGVEAGDVLAFQIHRIVTNLFKGHIERFEDLGVEHDIAMQKLRDHLPDQYKPYVDMSDYLTEEKYLAQRKKELDAGNDAIRELIKQLEPFDITIKRG